MRTPSSIRSLMLLAALAPTSLAIGCSTDSPTAPAQEASPPVDIPPPAKPTDAEVSFVCEAAPEGFDSGGRQTVAFRNESTDHYTEFLWRFGDGSTSRQEHPTHTYSIGGRSQFQATLVATAAHGSDEFSRFVPGDCEQEEEEEDGEDGEDET